MSIFFSLKNNSLKYVRNSRLMQSEMAKLFVNSGDPDQTPLSLSLSLSE